MKGILPNCLTHLVVGNPDGIDCCCADPSLARGMTENELADYQRSQMEGSRAMTDEEIRQWHVQMNHKWITMDNEMKDEDETKTGMQDRDIPDNLTELPPLIDDDLSDDKEAQPHKSTISKFFKKLGGIITAIYMWLMGLLKTKKK